MSRRRAEGRVNSLSLSLPGLPAFVDAKAGKPVFRLTCTLHAPWFFSNLPLVGRSARWHILRTAPLLQREARRVGGFALKQRTCLRETGLRSGPSAEGFGPQAGEGTQTGAPTSRAAPCRRGAAAVAR